MYKVESDFQYITHFCDTREIADTVVKELSNREDCTNPDAIIIEKSVDSAIWDPGGSLWTGDEQVSLELDGINILVYKQHLLSLKDWVPYARSKVKTLDGINYYLIHSAYMSCLCLSEYSLNKLEDILSDAILNIEAENALKKRNYAVQQSGFIPHPFNGLTYNETLH